MDESLFWLLVGLALSGLVAGWLHLRRRRAEASCKVEAARQLAAEAAPAERAAAERAAEERDALERGLAAQAAAEKLALVQAEIERTAAARVAAEQAAAAAQRERVAQADAERIAAAEAERLAAVAAEVQRLADAEAEKAAAAERERDACARAEAERVAATQAETARLAAAQQEARRAAEADAQRERGAALALAAEQAALAEAERQAAAEAARQRTAADVAIPPTLRVSKSADQTLVLVADDSKVVRIKTGRLLAQHQYQVAYAIDGLDAVQQMQSGQPDLLITDVEMPGMDGFELTRHIRGNPQTARLPVIMITAADDRHREQADLAGVSVLLGKPYAEDALIAHIRQAMGQGEPTSPAAGNTCRDTANALA